MLHITQAIIVEGIYDRQRVTEVCDAYCYITDGCKIFKDKEKREFIRLLAREKGLIVLTDSDRAGFLIRSHIKNITGDKNVRHAYIPEVFGKERRKAAPSAEGKLGVEGMEREALRKVLLPFADGEGVRGEEITKTDLFELGLSGGEGSKQRREALCRKLRLPTHLSANGLLDAANAIMTKKSFFDAAFSINSLFTTTE